MKNLLSCDVRIAINDVMNRQTLQLRMKALEEAAMRVRQVWQTKLSQNQIKETKAKSNESH